jgi:tRNA threonylcarbamoyladenosine modification (KEOPS) complex  Pcc1 subunit
MNVLLITGSWKTARVVYHAIVINLALMKTQRGAIKIQANAIV